MLLFLYHLNCLSQHSFLTLLISTLGHRSRAHTSIDKILNTLPCWNQLRLHIVVLVIRFCNFIKRLNFYWGLNGFWLKEFRRSVLIAVYGEPSDLLSLRVRSTVSGTLDYLYNVFVKIHASFDINILVIWYSALGISTNLWKICFFDTESTLSKASSHNFLSNFIPAFKALAQHTRSQEVI